MTATTQGRRAKVVWTTACRDCGMPCGLNEYHPYAACLMFRGCQDSAVVRANLPPSADTLAEMQRRVEAFGELAGDLESDAIYMGYSVDVRDAARHAAQRIRDILSPEAAASEEPK